MQVSLHDTCTHYHSVQVSLLEYRLQSSESRVKQLEQEKSRAVVETEQRMMAESIKEEVHVRLFCPFSATFSLVSRPP